MYTRLPDVASTCALENTRWDRTKPGGNPNISAADLRAPRRFHAPPQLPERAADMQACALLISEPVAMKGSAKSPQMHQRNSNFERSAVLALVNGSMHIAMYDRGCAGINRHVVGDERALQK